VLRKCETPAFFWPSADCLAWRTKAERARVAQACPELARVRRLSFPSMRAGGKDTFAKSQLLVIYDVTPKKYFANRVAKLAKWQTTPSPETESLHRCNRCMQSLQRCNVCNDT
jgi:hypothetical protein